VSKSDWWLWIYKSWPFFSQTLAASRVTRLGDFSPLV
jgi:hypothetical protein